MITIDLVMQWEWEPINIRRKDKHYNYMAVIILTKRSICPRTQ